ncbi:MAG: hypothetical protein GQ550_01795 [Gammaproteobacteria bacterium]|nr:hypothetical protein [Gammaproteobacteria bacterium]
MITYTHCWILFIVALMVPLNAVQAESEGEHELLFFLSGGPIYNHIHSEDGVQENDFILEADVIYGYQNGDFRFLAEYILSTEESELERFQLGWQADEETMGWAGRFHSPTRYWNSVYHHGRYLQTSITRPLVENFEDEGGILPAHVSGLMLETMHNLQGADGFQATISFGATSVIGDLELIPFDLLDASSKHRTAVDIRLAYLPDQLGENQFGLLLNWSNLVVDGSRIAEQQGLQRVEQGVIGVYADWRRQDWRILANLTYVDNQMIKQVQDQTDTFIAAYFQAEYEVNQEWIVFGRVEGTHGAENSEYLELFPSAIIERQMLGLRFDFYRKHALTLEVSNVGTQSVDLDQAWLQWSAVFP